MLGVHLNPNYSPLKDLSPRLLTEFYLPHVMQNHFNMELESRLLGVPLNDGGIFLSLRINSQISALWCPCSVTTVSGDERGSDFVLQQHN